ncbi:hypothetical protein ACI789_11810 [Geodermatophilus sp. SYSU D00965]
MATWVELRVHGVSGTPESEMLETDHVAATGGDGSVAHVRRTGPDHTPLPPEDDGRVLEAFHWGRLTSGSRWRALWLLLVPFGIVNAAQFMLPAAQGRAGRIARALVGGVLRVLGLLLTLVFVLSVVIGVVDLLAWQALGQRADLPLGGGRPEPVVLGLAGTAVVVLVLSRLGTDRAGPAAPDSPFADPGRHQRTRGPRPGFSSPDFFRGDPDAPVLRRLHVAASLALLACFGFAAAGEVGWARWSTGVLAVAVALVALLGDAPGASRTELDVAGSAWGRVARWLSLLVLAASGLLLVAGGGTVWRSGPTSAASGRSLPWADGTTAGLSAAVLLALACLAGTVLVLAALTPEDPATPARLRRLAGGWAGGLAATVGSFLAIGLAAGTAYLAQVALNAVLAAGVEVPTYLQRIAYGWGVAVALLAVVGVLAWSRRTPAARRRRDVVVAMYTPDGADRPRLSDAGLDRVARAVSAARVKNALAPAFVVAAVVAWALSLAAVAEQVRGGCDRAACAPGDLPPPWGWASAVTTDGPWARGLVGLGSGVLFLFAVAVAVMGSRAFGSAPEGAQWRRRVNVVWDVIAFWPRAAHPFVPAAYSQVAVPALVDRIEWLLSAEGDAEQVVVAAHSQGSLIGLAALRSIAPELYPRVGLVTFGSQLRMQFCRAFPAHVGPDVLRWLSDTWGERWVSLFRETDPVAGPVRSWERTPETGPLRSRRLWDEGPEDDWRDPRTLRRVCGGEWRLLDPVASDPTNQSAPEPPLYAHSRYWADPDWPLAVGVARGAATARRPLPLRGAGQVTGGRPGPP